MTRREVSPAFLGSVALHAAVAAALLITWPFARDLKVGSVVPGGENRKFQPSPETSATPSIRRRYPSGVAIAAKALSGVASTAR